MARQMVIITSARLARDPKVSLNSDTKKSVAKFPIAIDRGKDRNGNDLGADFPTVVCFGKYAEACDRFAAKGSLVNIWGRIRTGKYEGKDGKTVYTTEIYADWIEFLEWKAETDIKAEKENRATADEINSSVPDSANNIPSGFTQLDEDSEDIPF